MNAYVANHEFVYDRASSVTQPVSVSRGSRIGAAIRWLAEVPRRRAVLAELQSLSDHELADIGLSRGDLHRVFDASFAGAR